MTKRTDTEDYRVPCPCSLQSHVHVSIQYKYYTFFYDFIVLRGHEFKIENYCSVLRNKYIYSLLLSFFKASCLFI